MNETRINWKDDIVRDIQNLWKQGGYTVSHLQKKFGISKQYISAVVRNTKKTNDVNRHGFKIVKDFKSKETQSTSGPRGNYKGNNYNPNYKSKYKTRPAEDA